MLASFASPPSPRPRQWLKTTCASAECEAIAAALARAAAAVAARGEVEAALRWEAEAASQAEAARATTTRALVAWVTAAAAPPPPRAEEVLVQPRTRQPGKQPLVWAPLLVWAPWGWDRRTSRRADS